MPKNRALFVLIIFAAVVVLLIGGAFFQEQIGQGNAPTSTPSPEPTTEVFCYIGSEKKDFLQNPAVIEILRDRYSLTIDYQTEGSIEQVLRNGEELAQVDCLWPSNASAVEIFEQEQGETYPNENIFSTAMVIYSWPQVVDALEAQGLVTTEGDYYTMDTAALVDLLITEPPPVTWADLGINELYGPVNVHTTNPTESNSGHLFYAMMVNLHNGDGTPVTREQFEADMQWMVDYYLNQGDMFKSSGDLFENFIVNGWGTYPLMANYEFLRVELMLQYPDAADVIRDQIKVIYPQPTVWSSHPIIALTEGGEALIEAMQDQEIQQIAWEQHGLRSGLTGVQNDPDLLAVSGMPENVTSIMRLPRGEVMIELVELLKQAE